MPLKSYFVVVLTSEGEPATRIDLYCESLEEAKQRAKQLAHDRPVELWEAPALVARFEPLH